MVTAIRTRTAATAAVLTATVLLATALAGCTTDEKQPTSRAFPQPDEIRSENGVLQATFDVTEREVEVGGRQVSAKSFTGQFLGPTLRVAPGDTIELTLDNALDQATNLHFHGLHVSPKGRSDNIFLHIAPGERLTYEVRLPDDHATGTFWYHSHAHPRAEEQVFSGLSGALIVDGLRDHLPENLRTVREQTINLKDVQVDGNAIRTQNINSDAPTTRLLNGHLRPRTTLRPGEVQLWRLTNIGADIWYKVALERHRFTVVAEDGNPVWRTWSPEHLVLPPGKRYDVLVRAGARGEYALRTLYYDQGGDKYPDTVLGHVRVSGEQADPTGPMPTSMAPKQALGDQPVDRRRTLVFSEDDKQGQFFIDGVQFKEDVVNQRVKLGALEEWTIRNVTSEQHPFHIHVNDFQVMSVNGTPYDAPGLQDTVALPAKGEVVVRMPFETFTGRFVYHCHILAHEDHGMMGVVEVVP